jgi:hypothetical protein
VFNNLHVLESKSRHMEAQMIAAPTPFVVQNADNVPQGFLRKLLIESLGCRQFCDGQSTSVPQGSIGTESCGLLASI